MKENKIVYIIMTGCILMFSTISFAADATKDTSVIAENREKLLKTKSCPGCNLAGVNLNRADLAGADLQGADLSNAKFFLANLAGANLQKSKLRGAGFGGADLAKANFKGADLRDVRLDGAYYRGAHFDKGFLASLEKEKLRVDEEIRTETKDTDIPQNDVENQTTELQTDAIPTTDEKHAAPDTAVSSTNAVVLGPQRTNVENETISKTENEVNAKIEGEDASQGNDREPTIEPPDPSIMSGDGPPVKTVQPIKTIVLPEQESTEGTPDLKNETEKKTNGTSTVSDMSSDGADLAGAQKNSSANEQLENGINQGETITSPQNSVDKEKMESLARLVQSKKCFSCNLSGMDLSGMRLAQADLEKADLSGCNLEGAVLNGANLKGASLQHANLKKASMKSADLYKADLTAADLSGADLKNASVDETVFTDAVGVDERILKK